MATEKRRSNLGRIVLASLLGCSAGSAAVAQCSAGYFCAGLIHSMTITDTTVYIRLVGETAGLTNCTPYGGGYFTLPKSNGNYASYYATLLAAYLAKEPVTIRPVDASVGCLVSYIAVP